MQLKDEPESSNSTLHFPAQIFITLKCEVPDEFKINKVAWVNPSKFDETACLEYG